MKLLSRFFKINRRTFIGDRRTTKRYEIPLKIDYRDPLTGSQGQGLTKNICNRGLRFPVATKIAKGSILDLKIEDPNSAKSISTKAKVVWAEEFITGDDAEDVIYEAGVVFLKKRLY